MWRTIIRQWFLVALALVLTLGLLLHAPLGPFSEAKWFQHALVMGVLFVTALPVETSALVRAIRRPWVPLLGIAMNSVAVPLMAWGVGNALGLPTDLRHGLMVAGAVPCTLATAAVWTRRAGGNDTAAIMVTIVTNASCFLVTPAWLRMTTNVVNVRVDFSAMIQQLGLVIVLPMLLAQLVRQRSSWGAWATRSKAALGGFAQCGVLTMILMGAIKCGQQLAQLHNANELPNSRQTPLSALALMIAGVLIVHVTCLAMGMMLARLLKFDREDQIAVGFAGSQKTLMVGLHVSLQYFGGLTILPMVAYHVGQLIVDTLVADAFRRRSRPMS